MKPQYAGIGQTCPLFTVTTELGGSLAAGTKYFSFQLQNRCGFNLPSVSGAIAITANQKVKIVIPESARKAGWDIHYFVVSCGNTADASTHVQIVRVPGYQFGVGISPQSVLQNLPYTLYLSSEAHTALAPSVANPGGLPVGSDRLDGQVRFITSLGFFAEYRADSAISVSADVIAADVGQWVRIGSASTYVSNTEAGVGCDRSLTTVNPTTVIPTPPYPAIDRILPDWEAIYWLVNDDTYSLPSGTEFGIELSYNEKRSPDLLAGLFVAKFLGFVDTSTGTIRTEDGDGRDFPGVGGYFSWKPKQETPFTTADDLLPGEAIAISVKPYFSVAELNNQVSPNSVIGVVPVIRTQSGDYNPLGKLLPGGAVFNLGDRYRVVPGVGLSASILSGSAIVESFDFPVKPKRGIFGFTANTANQKVVINGNGAAFARGSSYVLSTSEALRAVVGTVSGSSNPGSWSTSAAIASGEGIQVTVNYPCDSSGIGTIRSDYPDVIAGNNKGSFNPSKIDIYLQRTDTNEIRKFASYSVVANATQAFTVTDWSDGIVASLPTASASFSLFASGNSAIASSLTGNFPATSYRACYAFSYDGNQITSISHASPPCIREWTGDFQPPSISIGTVTTLEPGESATVTNVGTATDIILDFGIPRGADGTGVNIEEEEMGFGGNVICPTGCSLDGSGKAFVFYAAQTNLRLNIAAGFDIDITPANNAIQLHRWSQEPNTGLTGREWVGELSQVGGVIYVNITSTYRWISVFAKNPANGNAYDGVCFQVDGNTITLVGFS